MMTNITSSQTTNDLNYRLQTILHHNIEDKTFDNLQLAKQLEVSERQLFRIIKQMTGLSPQKFIRHFRLQKAMKYMISGKYTTVNETAYAIGYTNVGYFINQFQKKYGRKPLTILQENGWR